MQEGEKKVDKSKEIKYEIKKLSECLYCLEKAYKCLVDVDDTDQVYEEIHNLIEKINVFRMNKEIELEEM